ncbi:MAG: transcriptional regulator, partial [bacterium]
GRAVRVFDLAKTVVDCFRYRRHVGLEVALEALRESLRGRRCKPADIDRYATLCGVATVVRPYLEAMA